MESKLSTNFGDDRRAEVLEKIAKGRSPPVG